MESEAAQSLQRAKAVVTQYSAVLSTPGPVKNNISSKHSICCHSTLFSKYERLEILKRRAPAQ